MAYRPEGRAYSPERGVISVISSVQVAGFNPATGDEAASLIEKETL